MTATAWRPEQDLDVQEWADQGRRLGVLGRSAGWWIGDWLNYGNHRFGERYVRAARITGYDVQTLMNMAYVASRCEAEARREKLSFSHHAEVAALAADQRAWWLERAEEERLSVRCLREEIRRTRTGSKPGPKPTALREARAAAAAAVEVVCPECGCHIAKQS